MKRTCSFIFMIKLLGISFITTNSIATQAAPIELTFSTFFTAESGQAKTALDWAKAIEQRSGRAVHLTYFPGGTLLKGDKTYEGVVQGVADIGFSFFACAPDRFPVMEAVDLPMGYPSGKAATKVAHDFSKIFQPKELEDVKVLFLHAHGPGLLHSKKPLRTMEDIKGMKIRATGFSAKIVDALGGVPITMGQGDAYEALHKGFVEGTLAPMESLKTWKQAEVIKYSTKCYDVGYTTAFFIIMNNVKWNSLPANVQRVFEDISERYVPVFGRLWDVLDKEGENHSMRLGNRIINLSKSESERWRKAVEPVIDSYVKRSSDNARYVAKIRELMH